MGYYPPGFLGPLHELARNFTVCDHWFSSVPGPTWTNRFFVHSGTSLGRVQMPEDAGDIFRSPYLEPEIDEPAGRPARAAAMRARPMSQAAAAKERCELFLAQQKAKVWMG